MYDFVVMYGNNKHLMTGPEGNSEFCFARISMFNIGIRGKKLYSKTKQNQILKTRAEIPATTSGHLQLHALITCNSGQHFAGNSELFPV